MLRPSRILSKWRRNEPVLVTSLQLTDPTVFEMTSLMGFDGIWLDLEHHAVSVETAGRLMRAARVGVSDIVARPAKQEMMRMGRLLESGAQGIMYPRCESAEEAAEVVRWSKFAPLGQRGFDSGNPDNPYTFEPMTDYLREANRETFVIVQLESARAVDAASRIAATPGVDAIMLGPADFSILSGFPGQWNHSKIDESLAAIARAAGDAGIQWGCPVVRTGMAEQLLEMGARILFSQADLLMVKNGMRRLQESFAPLGFTFDNQLDDKSNAKTTGEAT